MKLAYWMYMGPAHIGTLRVISSFKNMHALMHAPLGDDYFNVMNSMLERERDFTPVTTSVVNRHVLAQGSQERVLHNIQRKDREEHPDLIVVTPTCTSSILQEDLKNFIERASLSTSSNVLLADVNHYRINEFQAVDKTLQQIVEYFCNTQKIKKIRKTPEPSVNLIGFVALGFHSTHDYQELQRILKALKIKIHIILPEKCTAEQLTALPNAWINIIPYREVGLMTAKYLEKEWNMPYVSTIPLGLVETGKWIKNIEQTLNNLNSKTQSSVKINFTNFIQRQTFFISQAAWFSRSIDCQNLTGKRSVVFGDATHASTITKVLTREMGIFVACAGTYCIHDNLWFTEQIQGFCDEIIITNDHAQISEMIERIDPTAIFGTQMERHVGKRLNIPCGVISAPVHIQNFSLGYRPFLGYEGTNQIADIVYNSFTLGMEDHLLEIFGGHDTKVLPNRFIDSTENSLVSNSDTMNAQNCVESNESPLHWDSEAKIELQNIPGFVRKKVQKNTENYAKKLGINLITLNVFYSAKESLEAKR